jgi:integrase
VLATRYASHRTSKITLIATTRNRTAPHQREGTHHDRRKEHRIRQKEARLKAGTSWRDRNLVFCNRHGGFLDPDILLDQFHKLLDDAGLPRMRLHDLRHSAATILMAMKVPTKVIQELLGHSSVTITLNVYGHVLSSMQDEAVDQMERLFGTPENDGEKSGQG